MIVYYSGHAKKEEKLVFLDRVPLHVIGDRPVAESEAILRSIGYEWFSERAGITIDESQFPGCQSC